MAEVNLDRHLTDEKGATDLAVAHALKKKLGNLGFSIRKYAPCVRRSRVLWHTYPLLTCKTGISHLVEQPEHRDL
jgi:hypothetical protein